MTASTAAAPASARTAPGDRPAPARYTELEAFRALAALAVVVFHAYQFARVDGAYIYAGRPPDLLLHQLDGAVAVFLALSGFLLFQPVAVAVRDGRPVAAAGRFLARRAVRVVPLYLVATLVVWGFRTPTLRVGWVDLATHLTFTHVFFADYVFSLIGPAWSLAVEVHCYLLLALILPLSGAVARRAGPRARAAWVLAVPLAFIAASVAWKAWEFRRGVPLDRFEVWFATPARLDNFALGMLLGAVVALGPRRLPGPVAVGLRFAALAVAVGAALWRDPGTWGDAFFPTIVAVGAVLLLAGSVLGQRDGAWTRALSWRPLALVGLWSYSIYLWHEPAIHWLEDLGWLSPTAPFWVITAVFVVVGTGCGFLSYWVIEYPTSHLRYLLDEGRPATSTTPAPPGVGRARRVAPAGPAPERSAADGEVGTRTGPGEPRRPPSGGTGTGRGEHILVVDDDELMVALVRKALEREGYRVSTAGDGQAALAVLDEELPALVVSDVNMPGLDGFSLLGRVRSEPRTRWVPVLLLTTRREVADVVEGLALGADDYLTKPFAVPELLARLRAKLDRPPVPADLLPVDRETGLLSRARFDEEVGRELGRAGRGGRPGAVGVIGLAELQGLELRLGRLASDATTRQIAAALQSVLRPLDLVARIDGGHLGVLMPETNPAEAAVRLRAATSRVAALAIEIAGEHLRVTPSAGYAPFAAGAGPEELLRRATVGLDYATSRLDLLPLAWEPSMDPVVAAHREAAAVLRSGPRRARAWWRRRLRTPAQILASLVLGLVLPAFAYRALDRAGYDITWVMYVVVVVTLAATGTLILIEGLLALRREDPPDEPGEPYPPATAVIAAYLPNEAATVLDTVEAFLRIDYPAPLQVILAYNTPEPMAIEVALQNLAAAEPGFEAYRVEASTSKAQNVNAALARATGLFVGVFDADHHPDPGSFRRAWRWLSHGYDVVQGHCLVRNGGASRLARMVAVEFEAMYAVSHPGRARLHGFAIFGGSNGYWRTDLLHETRMRGTMLTEDIDSSLRVLEAGGRVRSDPGLVSRELATTTLRQVWNQRMRWAQGWFQVSLRHLRRGLRSKDLTLRQKLGLVHLLVWRELYPWLSLQMFPIVGYWIWRGDALDWKVPIFLVTTLFTVSVGPVQTYFAYRLADPEIRRHRRWFAAYLAFSSLFYTEYKNIIARVAQIKELTGERDWRVTPRTAPSTGTGPEGR